MVVYNFKQIKPVPSSNDFIDIVLSKTQRKTPTVVHPGYKISRIRSFYMRKVKFTHETFSEKLSSILEQFPLLDDIHPFYSDLCNVLYDKDHYKLALGQLSTARNLLSSISRDYIRLLKYGDTLYRCKQLKRAALGRMCTLMKKHKNSLAYLEEVRKHLSRLPSIDPNTRTLLVTGFPNVGKSSFLNTITRADVDVQPYAFTTKSLFVGHFDYKYLRYQVIDTPGILDKPLDQRNTIEMQAITALAHLPSCILYFFDLSETCGFSIEQQLSLFENIAPLFANKGLIMVINKVDLVKLEDLDEDIQTRLKSLSEKIEGAELIEMSSHGNINVTAVKRSACEKLISMRIDKKLRGKGKKLEGLMNRITVALPKERDSKEREAMFKPEADDSKRIEYNGSYREHWDVNEEEKYDPVPEIIDGKNVVDYIDEGIEQKLRELEEEEDRILGEMAVDDDEESVMDEEETELYEKIRDKKRIVIKEHRLKRGKNRTGGISLRDKSRRKSLGAVTGELSDKGYQVGKLRNLELVLKKRKRVEREEMDIEKVRGRKIRKSEEGAMTKDMRRLNEKMIKYEWNKMKGKAGESDRAIQTAMPKHLFAGKTGRGKRDRR
eukprot:snap_masked-scaffold_8-processed-gene-10.24-mRNA-1 protein AED:0.07 eAED:0.07 QI:0/-1/0/1/-1/1/1/0/606